MTPTIFDACTPRPEVLRGELNEDLFAARLKDVVDGKAPEVYRDATTFFANTFPTNGLRDLLREALGRLTGAGPNFSPIIRLETAFGGGKTHNLIALYHAARGTVNPSLLGNFVEPSFVPAPGAVDVAAVVGNDLDPSTGLLHADGIRTYTLWGELAYQLGKNAGYALARESDIQRIAPGSGLFAELIGGRPTLIMLDEIARHLRQASGVKPASGEGTLAKQTSAFVMALLEYASSQRNVVVVLTLADVHDAFGEESDSFRSDLAEIQRLSARQETVLVPTNETELAAIVTHRLFEQISPDAAVTVASMYHQAYQEWHSRDVALPESVVRPDYAEAIRRDYPFHPELLDVLNRKISTIPNFQKTRGALRLLALVIRNLWQSQPAATSLVHLHHIELGNRDIAADLTSRLQRPAFQQVIQADIVSARTGSDAHAQVLDRPYLAAGKPAYHQRVATTVFLHSLSQGIATGVDPAPLRLAVLEPGNDPLLVDRACEKLEDEGWFFEWDTHRYRFKTEPSLNKIIAEEIGAIGTTRAKQELDRRIQNLWTRGKLKPVFFPREAAEIDDDSRDLKLVIMHYDAVQFSRAGTPAASRDGGPPELVRRLFANKGTQGTFRTFQNNIIFLVADRDAIERMIEVAQRHLAIERILSDSERLRGFDGEQRKKLQRIKESTELDARVAITRAYKHLFFPQADAPKEHNNLNHYELPTQEQGDQKQDQADVIIRALRAQNKILSGDEPTLSAIYIKQRAWNQNQTSGTTEELRAAFARRFSLPFLLDLNQLKNSIRNGIKTHTWIYYDNAEGIAYDHDSPAPAIQISDEVTLYLPEEGARMGLPIKGKTIAPPPDPEQIEYCPLCTNEISPRNLCTCGDSITPPPPALRGEGPPQQAFQQLLDACHDQKVSAIRELRLELHGGSKEGATSLRTLGTILPTLGKATYQIHLRYIAEFGADQRLTIEGALNDTLYKRLKQVTDGLAQEATQFIADFILVATYDEEGLKLDSDAFSTLHAVVTGMTGGLGAIVLSGKAL